MKHCRNVAGGQLQDPAARNNSTLGPPLVTSPLCPRSVSAWLVPPQALVLVKTKCLMRGTCRHPDSISLAFCLSVFSRAYVLQIQQGAPLLNLQHEVAGIFHFHQLLIERLQPPGSFNVTVDLLRS